MIAVLSLGSGILASHACLAMGDTKSMHTFNLPSQPLAAALEAFGIASGVQFLYESDIVGEGYAPPLKGQFTIDEALRTLLAGTDFVVREVRENVITIARPSPEAGLLPPPTVLGTPDMSLDTLHIAGEGDIAAQEAIAAYGLAVQSDVQTALGRRDSTRYGSYVVGVGLWIGPSRAVQRLEILRSSGSNERDAAIAAVLRDLIISKAAPAHLPQPVRVTIRVSSQ